MFLSLVLGFVLFPTEAIAQVAINYDSNDSISADVGYNPNEVVDVEDKAVTTQDLDNEHSDNVLSYTDDNLTSSNIDNSNNTSSINSEPFDLYNVSANFNSATGASDIPYSETKSSTEPKLNSSESDPIIIRSYEQLVNAVHIDAGGYIELGSDIFINTYTQIANDLNFHGTLDGKGHKIYNNIDSMNNSSFCSLFNSLGDGTVVKNLNLNINISYEVSRYAAASLAVFADGNVEISNCTIDGAITIYSVEDYNPALQDTFAGSSVGGIIARVKSGSTVNFSNVVMNAQVSCLGDSTIRYCGGFVGYSDGADLIFDNCQVSEVADIYASGANSVTGRVFTEIGKFVAA